MSAESVSSSEHTHPGPDTGSLYTPHRPEQTLLHRTIREQLETFLAQSRERGHPAPRFVEQVLRAFVRALFAELCRRGRHHWGIRAAQCGAVTFLQRFGSALNLNVHFHTLAFDGVYADTGGPGAAPRFLPLPPPDDDAVARVLAGTARRLQRLAVERAGEDEDALARDEPLLAVLAGLRCDGAAPADPTQMSGGGT